MSSKSNKTSNSFIIVLSAFLLLLLSAFLLNSGFNFNMGSKAGFFKTYAIQTVPPRPSMSPIPNPVRRAPLGTPVRSY